MADAPILITGGAGFIGSHLCDALLEKGYAVRILDDLSTGKRSNLQLGHPQLELIEGDVADAALVARAVAGCQAVVHLAAVASVQASVEDPVKTHQSNFIGTLNVCEAMRQHGVRRVLFASSAAVYGNNGEGQSIAEDTPKAPLTPYAVDKLASEQYLDFYRRQHGLEPVVFPSSISSARARTRLRRIPGSSASSASVPPAANPSWCSAMANRPVISCMSATWSRSWSRRWSSRRWKRAR